MINDVEPEGGDPPCWAHLFDDEPSLDMDPEEKRVASSSVAEHDPNEQGIVDLVALSQEGKHQGAVWRQLSKDLNVNLIVFAAGEGVAPHVNTEVDMLLVGVAGTGAVTVDGKAQILRPGQALIIPKGANRGTRSMSDSFAYLSCHRRRDGLWPSKKSS